MGFWEWALSLTLAQKWCLLYLELELGVQLLAAEVALVHWPPLGQLDPVLEVLVVMKVVGRVVPAAIATNITHLHKQEQRNMLKCWGYEETTTTKKEKQKHLKAGLSNLVIWLCGLISPVFVDLTETIICFVHLVWFRSNRKVKSQATSLTNYQR